jgi:hypothetical protein
MRVVYGIVGGYAAFLLISTQFNLQGLSGNLIAAAIWFIVYTVALYFGWMFFVDVYDMKMFIKTNRISLIANSKTVTTAEKCEPGASADG